MDGYDLDVRGVKKCCTHYVMPDGRLMPGCSYNNLYRHKTKRFLAGGAAVAGTRPSRLEWPPGRIRQDPPARCLRRHAGRHR